MLNSQMNYLILLVIEDAKEKLDGLLAAKGDDINGIGSYGYKSTVAGAQTLAERGDKKIQFVGIDDDPAVIKAIQEGYILGTMSQNPYSQAYVGMEALRLLKSGYKVKDGVYFIDSGSFLIDISNADTYKDLLKKDATKILKTFTSGNFVAP